VIARACLLLLACGLVVGLGACDSEASHGNLDKWMQTENGPGKLKGALANEKIDPDLAAHAAENLMIIRDDSSVREVFAKMSPERRTAVLAKLGPRLWDLARIEGEMTAPNDQQTAAKDLLFDMRTFADDAGRATIDGYLIEWYTSGYYEGRAETGRFDGAQVVRAIGKPAGPGMIKAANAIVGAPPTADGKRLKVGDNLLLGLAVTGDPEAVKYVLALLGKESIDKTLPERTMSALFLAYVEPPGGVFEKADPAGLTPNVAAIGKVALDADASNRLINDAVAVLVAAGPPACLDPLIEMINTPHDSDRYLWVGANNALRCGKAAAIERVAHELSENGKFDHAAIEGSVVGEIVRSTPRDQAITAARALLTDKSWVARWIGVEVLAGLGSKEDAAKLAGLAGDKAVLRGYWGDQSELPKGERKPEPSLGKRAQELAKMLEAG
jgi:hypothetical protein